MNCNRCCEKLGIGYCEKCNKVNAQAHHDDYSKPLNIRWLCPLHHKEEHKKVNPGKALSDKEIRNRLLIRRKETETRNKLIQDRWKQINKLYPEFTLREIAKVYGISHQRVQQIIQKVAKINQ